MTICRASVLAALMAVMVTMSTPASATVIMSVTGPIADNSAGIFSDQTLAFSFSVGQPYSNVEISPDLIGNFGGTAYLMTQIGVGTTVADQIATSSFTSSDVSFGTFQAVFRDVTIGAGTYFVVLSTSELNPLQGLGETNSPAVVADFGASTDGILYGTPYGSSSGGYAPARTFSIVSGGAGPYAPEFIVTGDAAVPEPATWTLFGFVTLLCCRKLKAFVNSFGE